MINIIPALLAQPGVKGGGQYKYYGRISNRNKVNFRYIARVLSQRTTLNAADVAAAIEGFREVILEELLAGNNVKLDGLGTFSLSLRTEGVEDLSKFNKAILREVRIQFLAAPELKETLKTAEFHFQKSTGNSEIS